LNTRLAAVAYRKKSYHSIVVPSRLASRAVRAVRDRRAAPRVRRPGPSS
jgi:hypothetical protein